MTPTDPTPLTPAETTRWQLRVAVTAIIADAFGVHPESEPTSKAADAILGKVDALVSALRGVMVNAGGHEAISNNGPCPCRYHAEARKLLEGR